MAERPGDICGHPNRNRRGTCKNPLNQRGLCQVASHNEKRVPIAEKKDDPRARSLSWEELEAVVAENLDTSSHWARLAFDLLTKQDQPEADGGLEAVIAKLSDEHRADIAEAVERANAGRNAS